MQPVYNTPSTYVKADAGQRFVAAFIDGLVGSVPYILLSFVSYQLAMIGYAANLAYFLTKDALPEVGGFLGGQSIGKKIMNIINFLFFKRIITKKIWTKSRSM